MDLAIKLKGGVFSTLFDNLALAVSTRPLNMPDTIDFARDETPTSDLSGSSEEDKDEDASRDCLIALVTAILKEENLGTLNQDFGFVW
jgi:hypothetical protein